MSPRRTVQWTRMAMVGVLCAALGRGTASGQGAPPNRPLPPVLGDGRVHGPPSIEVGTSELRPYQVGTIIVHYGGGAMLRFPAPVVAAPLSDPQTFRAAIAGNMVIVSVTDCQQGCSATMWVTLQQGSDSAPTITVAPFKVVVDSTRTETVLRDFSDPLPALLAARERAARLDMARTAQAALPALVQQEMARCVASEFRAIPVGVQQAWTDPVTGESIGVRIDDWVSTGACTDVPEVYLRYTLFNTRYAPLSDVAWSLTRRIGGKGVPVGLPVVSDQRSPAVVPPMRSVRGLLRVDASRPLRPGDVLSLTLRADGYDVPVGSILTVPAEWPGTVPARRMP